MFGRKARAQISASEHETYLHERAQYWKGRFAEAADDHQTTRTYVEYRTELLFEWLNDFDSRVVGAQRQLGRQIGHLIVAASGLFALLLIHHLL